MRVWIITEEHNDYDQHGEYFIAAYPTKPTITDIVQKLKVSAAAAQHITAGGGRIREAQVWWHLREFDTITQAWA